MPSPPIVATRALVAILIACATAYLVAVCTGAYTVIYRTALIPAFTAHALLWRDREGFIREWLPFLALTLFFDAGRGAAFVLVEAGYRPVYAEYVIQLEQAVAGVPAISIPLQSAFRSVALDWLMVVTHGSHFVFFLIFGLVVWNRRRESFWLFRRSMALVFAGGLLGYALIPTAPPWMAAEAGLIPPVAHTIDEIYARYVPGLYGAFNTNPVAAMPSIHIAFPAVCALVSWRVFSRIAATLASAYALLVCFAVMYLGDHYLVDVLAGVLLSAIAVALVARVGPPRRSLSLAAVLTGSAVLLLATAGLALA